MLWQSKHPHLGVHLRSLEQHSQYLFKQLLFWHPHPLLMRVLESYLARFALFSWFQQRQQRHITPQQTPLDKHQQQSFKHLVFLHEHILVFLWGRLSLRVRQLGQHQGAQGKGDRKQLQLQLRHYPATKQTQLWIFGGIICASILGCFSICPSDFYEAELEFEEPLFPGFCSIEFFSLTFLLNDLLEAFEDYFARRFSKSECLDYLLFPDPILFLHQSTFTFRIWSDKVCNRNFIRQAQQDCVTTLWSSSKNAKAFIWICQSSMTKCPYYCLYYQNYKTYWRAMDQIVQYNFWSQESLMSIFIQKQEWTINIDSIDRIIHQQPISFAMHNQISMAMQNQQQQASPPPLKRFAPIESEDILDDFLLDQFAKMSLEEQVVEIPIDEESTNHFQQQSNSMLKRSISCVHKANAGQKAILMKLQKLDKIPTKKRHSQP